MTHTVQSKETLYSIAKKYGLTVEQIISLNNLVSTNLNIGQNLIVSLPSPITPNKPTTTVKSIYEKRNVFVVEKLPKLVIIPLRFRIRPQQECKKQVYSEIITLRPTG
jgi:peptidoglycan endopeptidase LytF